MVTGSVWDVVENDYLAVSCPCSPGPSPGIMADTEIARQSPGDPKPQGRPLTAHSCPIHGEGTALPSLPGSVITMTPMRRERP